jgi:hypothetical protein
MKTSSLRWTVSQAASEFGMDRRTVDSRLKAAATVPAPDGTYSTGQIASAIYGDLAGEKLRKLRHEANLAEMKDLQMRGELIFASDVEGVWADAIVQLRKELEGADYIPSKARAQLLKDLLKIKLADFAAKDAAEQLPEEGG